MIRLNSFLPCVLLVLTNCKKQRILSFEYGLMGGSAENSHSTFVCRVQDQFDVMLLSHKKLGHLGMVIFFIMVIRKCRICIGEKWLQISTYRNVFYMVVLGRSHILNPAHLTELLGKSGVIFVYADLNSLEERQVISVRNCLSFFCAY